MGKSNCCHVIGLWNDYEDARVITYDELKELSRDVKAFTMKDYLDLRRSTNLSRFNFCPYCGEKIDWGKYREINKK